MTKHNNSIIGKRQKRKIEIQQKMKQQKQSKEKKKLNYEIFDLISLNKIQELGSSEKTEVLQKLYNLILSFPEQNHDKINLIFVFLQDNNIHIVSKAFELITNLFIDIIPDYRIKEDLVKDKTKKAFNFSKEVEQIRGFEKNIGNSYKQFIELFDKFLKADIDIDNSHKISIFSQVCRLLISHPVFNFSDEIVKIISNKLYSPIYEIRQVANECFKELLTKADNSREYLELKIKIVNSISHVLFNINESKLDKDVIILLNQHNIQFPKVEKQKKKQSKLEKEVKREIKEYEIGDDLDYDTANRIFNQNLKILKKVLFVYLEFLTTKPQSKFIRYIIDQISKQADHINVEILHDLQKCIYKFISLRLTEFNTKKEKEKEKEKTGILINNINLVVTALKTCIIIKEKLTSEIVSVEDTYLLNNVYFLIDKIKQKEILNNLSIDELYNFMELIHYSIIQNRQYSVEIVCSFIKRLSLTISELKNDDISLGFVILLKRILDLYPQTSFLIYDEDNDDMFDNKINDPSLSNGKLTNIKNELIRISRIGGMSQRIVQQINEKSQIKNKDFMNYFEVLLKNKNK